VQVIFSGQTMSKVQRDSLGAMCAPHQGRFNDIHRSFATFRISNGHCLRCTAAGGLAGLVVRRLFDDDHEFRTPQLYPQRVLKLRCFVGVGYDAALYRGSEPSVSLFLFWRPVEEDA